MAATRPDRHDSVFTPPATPLAENISPPNVQKHAYITLLTRASYLAGVVLLAHTLRQHGSQYALIVLYTPTLTEVALKVLEFEAKSSNLILKSCDLLVPPEHHQLNVAVERFTDTWTKLRVFQQYDFGYEKLCYLDADMILRKNMDSVFDDTNHLPQGWIAAVHDCVCSPDKLPWTPDDHCAENCPLSAQQHPEALTTPLKVEPNSRATYKLFNSGMFVFHPTRTLWETMFDFFTITDLLSTFRFPDQDFMTHFFDGRWMSLSWKYNAVKTMAYRHLNIWRDDEIVCLHLIVDKPWAKRIGDDGIAGFKGNDGKTHRWWWEAYEAWFELRQEQGEFGVVAILSKHVARRESEMSEAARPDMGAIGVGVHDVTNKEGW